MNPVLDDGWGLHTVKGSWTVLAILCREDVDALLVAVAATAIAVIAPRVAVVAAAEPAAVAAAIADAGNRRSKRNSYAFVRTTGNVSS
jgi:hypothetical protein